MIEKITTHNEIIDFMMNMPVPKQFQPKLKNDICICNVCNNEMNKIAVKRNCLKKVTYYLCKNCSTSFMYQIKNSKKQWFLWEDRNFLESNLPNQNKNSGSIKKLQL